MSWEVRELDEVTATARIAFRRVHSIFQNMESLLGFSFEMPAASGRSSTASRSSAPPDTSSSSMTSRSRTPLSRHHAVIRSVCSTGLTNDSPSLPLTRLTRISPTAATVLITGGVHGGW